MFSANTNPSSMYRKLSVETETLTADPYRLILMLFEAAASAIAEARLHMESGNIAKKGLCLSKALEIISNGLKVSVDREAGGQLAEQLIALYDYMCTRLLHANLRNDLGALDEVAGLLNEIHSAWIEIRDKLQQEQAA